VAQESDGGFNVDRSVDGHLITFSVDESPFGYLGVDNTFGEGLYALDSSITGNGPADGTQVRLSGIRATTTGGTIGLSNSGSGAAINIIPTETTLRACIAVNGLYPPRP